MSHPLMGPVLLLTAIAGLTLPTPTEAQWRAEARFDAPVAMTLLPAPDTTGPGHPVALVAGSVADAALGGPVGLVAGWILYDLSGATGGGEDPGLEMMLAGYAVGMGVGAGLGAHLANGRRGVLSQTLLMATVASGVSMLVGVAASGMGAGGDAVGLAAVGVPVAGVWMAVSTERRTTALGGKQE